MAFMQSVKKFIRDEEGVVTVEYALVAAILAVSVVGTLSLLQTNIKEIFVGVNKIVDKVATAITTYSGTVSDVVTF